MAILKTALLIVDIQYDFLPPDGSLAVSGGDKIIPIVHELMDKGRWDLIVASQDYHPSGHISFASAHEGHRPFTAITVPLPDDEAMGTSEITGKTTEITQMLWPDHCVIGTKGCLIEESISQRLDKWKAKGKGHIVQKGSDIRKDAYSAFATPTLSDILHQNEIRRIIACGLATDYCVRWSVLGGLEEGFQVLVIEEAIAGVDQDGSTAALKEMTDKGARLVSLQDPEIQKMLNVTS